jgi:protein-disulfide isomerase
MSQRTFRTRTPLEDLVVEQALLLAQQLAQAAHDAPDGQVLARVEALAVPAGRERARQAVEATLQAQAEAAEKKGRPPAAAPAAPNLPGTRGAPGGTS